MPKLMLRFVRSTVVLTAISCVVAVSSMTAAAQEPDISKPIADVPVAEADDDEEQPPVPEEMESPIIKGVIAAFAPPEGATRLAKDARLWIDKPKQRIIIDGYVALNEGLLEMFACPAGTKEHESAIAVLARSRYVHAALLAIGATPGRPVQFQPQFQPPTGDRIAVWVLWRDKDGKRHRQRAQEWICKTGTKENLAVDFVFAGSQWWTNENTGTEHYSADDGDLICVSNFASATLDVPIESSKDAEYLEFSACPDVIPPRGTPIRLVMSLMKSSADQKPSDVKPGDVKPGDVKTESQSPAKAGSPAASPDTETADERKGL